MEYLLNEKCKQIVVCPPRKRCIYFKDETFHVWFPHMLFGYKSHADVGFFYNAWSFDPIASLQDKVSKVEDLNYYFVDSGYPRLYRCWPICLGRGYFKDVKQGIERYYCTSFRYRGERYCNWGEVKEWLRVWEQAKNYRDIPWNFSGELI
jgi:hypothetical protein